MSRPIGVPPITSPALQSSFLPLSRLAEQYAHWLILQGLVSQPELAIGPEIPTGSSNISLKICVQDLWTQSISHFWTRWQRWLSTAVRRHCTDWYEI